MIPGSPVTLAVVIVLLAAGYAAVREVVRRRRPAQIVPLVEGDTIDGYCAFCGEEGHKALNCTALDGVMPVVTATAYGPAGGKGCTGDHDPVPVVVGEGDPLVEPEEPVGYLCSKCLASVTADGKGYAGGVSITTGAITAEKISAGNVTIGVYTLALPDGHGSIEVRQDGDGFRGRIKMPNGQVSSVTDRYDTFEGALRAACRVAGVEPNTEEVRAHGVEGPIRTIVTGLDLSAPKPIRWGSPAQFEQNARAYRREAEWGAGLIVYDPANLDRLRGQLAEVVGQIERLTTEVVYEPGSDQARISAESHEQMKGLFEDATWLREAIRHEEARRVARSDRDGKPEVRSVVEAEQAATVALRAESPSRALVQTLTHDRAHLAKTMQTFVDTLVPGTMTAEQSAAYGRMDAAMRQLDRAIEFHSTRATPALILHPPTHDYPRH